MENAANKKAAESFDGTSDSAAFAFTAKLKFDVELEIQFLKRNGTPRRCVGFHLRFACGETGLAGYQPHRDRSLVALLMLRKRHHRRTPQSGPAKTFFIFVCTRSTVLRAFGGVYGQHHHQAVQCVGAVGNVQHVGVRPVQ